MYYESQGRAYASSQNFPKTLAKVQVVSHVGRPPGIATFLLQPFREIESIGRPPNLP